MYPLASPDGLSEREFRPGHLRSIMPSFARLDALVAAPRCRRQGAGFEGLMAPDVRNHEGQFVGWSPGRGPIVAPDGMPWRRERGVDLVVELHLIPGTAPVDVQRRLGFFFTDQPPTATPVELTMGVIHDDIPAHQTAHIIKTRYTLPVEVTLLSLYPHAHYLGKAMESRQRCPAVRPDGC